MADFSVAIQAGGMSSRMGRDKGLLPIGTITLVEHIIRQLQPLDLDFFLISNTPESYEFLKLPIYSDIYWDVGALGGLHTILSYARTDYVLALACDMPFVELGLINYLIGKSPGKDIVIPSLGKKGYLEPFRAVYSLRCLPAVEAAIRQGKRRVVSFFDGMDVVKVLPEEIHKYDPEEKSFININTPEDYEKVRETLSKDE